MTPLQDRFFGQADFTRQLCAWLPLQYPTQEQHHLLRCQVAPRKDGAAVQVINPLTALTAPHGQATLSIYTKEALRPVWLDSAGSAGQWDESAAPTRPHTGHYRGGQ